MPVEDEINLDKPLTDAQIEKLEKDADRAEKAAEKQELAAEKAKQAAEKAQQANTMTTNILGTTASSGVYDKSYRPRTGYDASTLINNVGALPRGGLEESEYSYGFGLAGMSPESGERKGYRRVGEAESQTPVAGQSPRAIEARMAAIQQAQNEIRRQAQQNALDIKLQKQRDMQMIGAVKGGFGKVQQGFAFGASPANFIRGQGMAMLGRAGVYGAIAAMVIQQVQGLFDQINEQIKQMFAPGGVYDVRKDVLDAVKNVSSLKSIIDMEQGRVFFTSDTGESLRQGVPQAANTNTRVNGFKQYTQEYER
jgi:hypothetical protein